MKTIEPNHQPLTAIRNGVDLNLFQPSNNRDKLRKQLGIQKFTLLMVGNLVELKGHKLAIEALKQLPDTELIIIGAGPLETELKALTQKLILQDRVNFVGGLKQAELPDYYAAADCYLLASSREGWANVLLESMACGTPVVATKVWGTPEVVNKPEAGILIDRTVVNIVEGIKLFISNNIDRKLTRKYAANYSWQGTSEALEQLYSKLINHSENT